MGTPQREQRARSLTGACPSLWSVPSREGGAQGEATADPLRDELLDAAAVVFAREGYEGTKILDIVAEAGVSTGAVYGRFGSKNALLQEAVVRRAASVVTVEVSGAETVVQLLLGFGALTDDEAVRLEALVAARREPEVAEALQEADRVRTARLRPLFEAATLDGTIDPEPRPRVRPLPRAHHLPRAAPPAGGPERAPGARLVGGARPPGVGRRGREAGATTTPD